jgi:hypothetical protein
MHSDFVLPSAYEILTKHFKICGLFDLFAHSERMPELYSKLKKIKKDRYEVNERIIFVLSDVDDHLDENSPGFTLYNLQLILADLDIPNYFCLILTNRPNYNECTKIVQRQLTTDPSPIRSITNLLDPNWAVQINPRDFNLADIHFPFCVLSRQSRVHRSYFMSQIFKHGLHNLGMIGYNNIPFTNSIPAIEESSIGDSQHLSFLSRRLNSEICLIHNEGNRTAFKEFLLQYPTYKNFDEHVDLTDKPLSCEFLGMSPILQALIYVGLETVVAPSKLHMSRISLRGIVEQRPFILLAQPGMLKFMRSLGFKTFDQFWDESYDDIVDFELRVDAIINILKTWSTLSPLEAQQQAIKMKEILDYNYNYYVNDFENVLKTELDNSCRKNLSDK